TQQSTPEIYTLSLHDALPISFRIPGVEGLSLDANFGVDEMLNFNKRWTKPWMLYTLDGFDDNGEPILSGSERGVSQPELFQRYRSEEHTSELQSRENLVCRLL